MPFDHAETETRLCERSEAIQPCRSGFSPTRQPKGRPTRLPRRSAPRRDRPSVNPVGRASARHVSLKADLQDCRVATLLAVTSREMHHRNGEEKASPDGGALFCAESRFLT